MKLSTIACIALVIVSPFAAAQPNTNIPFVPSSTKSIRSETAPPEPDISTALNWWVPQRGVWTPLGWKDHLLRFTVPYNGALLCSPFGVLGKPHTQKYRGQDFQLTFYPASDNTIPALPATRTRLHRLDGGFGWQGWREDMDAPVLYNMYPRDEGIVLKTEMFADVSGSDDVTTAMEPLFAWVRMSVDHVDENDHPEEYSFNILLSRIWFEQHGMAGPDEIAYLEALPELAKLKMDDFTSDTLASRSNGEPGFLLRQKEKVRLKIMPDGDAKIRTFATPTGESIVLRIVLPARKGAHADLLVPMLPEIEAIVNAESAQGYDGALARANAFWARKPQTAARIHVPEKYINEAIRRNIQFAEIIAELNPENGEYSFLSGAYGYDALWSTPTSMVSHMFLDLLGYHDSVERHTQLISRTRVASNLPVYLSGRSRLFQYA